MSEQYTEAITIPSGTYNIRPNYPRELEELIESHKSNWVANSRGGEPNHWEEKR